jgi:hypothetical protein
MIGEAFYKWRYGHGASHREINRMKPKQIRWLERAVLDGWVAGRNAADAELRKVAEIATRELEEMRAEKAKNPFPGLATVVE